MLRFCCALLLLGVVWILTGSQLQCPFEKDPQYRGYYWPSPSSEGALCYTYVARRYFDYFLNYDTLLHMMSRNCLQKFGDRRVAVFLPEWDGDHEYNLPAEHGLLGNQKWNSVELFSGFMVRSSYDVDVVPSELENQTVFYGHGRGFHCQWSNCAEQFVWNLYVRNGSSMYAISRHPWYDGLFTLEPEQFGKKNDSSFCRSLTVYANGTGGLGKPYYCDWFKGWDGFMCISKPSY